MPPTHPFWCLPSTCEWATVTGGRERQRETEREEGRGRKKGALERVVYFARLTENSPKCWAGITLSNIDCDFLGEKQPALVNLGWLWNTLDPPPHIVECQKRNALQQFIAALQNHRQTIWNDRSITKCLRFKMSSLFLLLSVSVSLDQFSPTVCSLYVCRLVQHLPEPALQYQMVYQRLIVRHFKKSRDQVLNFKCYKSCKCSWQWKSLDSLDTLRPRPRRNNSLCLVGHFSVWKTDGLWQDGETESHDMFLYIYLSIMW